MRIKPVNRLIIARLNINSFRNEFEFSVEFARGKVDILMISETKFDESFPLGQFKINEFNASFRHGSNSYGGGIMPLVREDILETYGNFIFLDNFNACMKHSALKDFCNLYSFTSYLFEKSHKADFH